MKTEFVEFVPEVLQEDTLYISEKYQTAIHKCCCGCGCKVVTPTGTWGGWAGWNITIDGDKVTLSPSIGNWQLPCKSHYFITNSEVRWCK